MKIPKNLNEFLKIFLSKDKQIKNIGIDKTVLLFNIYLLYCKIKIK